MEIRRVWFVSHYSMPPEYEMRIKTLKYAEYFQSKGIDCTIFTASTIHNTDINLIEDRSLFVERQYGSLKYVHIRCSNYSGNGVKRILNMEQFAYRFARVAKQFEPPDVVVTETYCPAYRPIFGYCKHKRIPIVLDVRDLWPQSIVEYLHYSEKNPIIQIMYMMEKHMYMQASRIIFSFFGGYEYIRDRGLDKLIPKEKVFYINNGIDLQEFDCNVEQYQIRDDDLDNPNLFKVVYTGSIRKVNHLGSLLDAAKEIKDPRIKLLIWGTGDELPSLQRRVVDEEINNVVFKGFVEKKYIPYITRNADLNLIHNNPSSMFRYGISFNKIFDYMAAGKPTLSTFPCKYNPAVMEGTGIAVDVPTAKNIADAIESMMNADSETYCRNAKRAAARYDYSALAEQLLTVIQEIETPSY